MGVNMNDYRLKIMCVEGQLSIMNVDYRLTRMSSQFRGMTHILLLDGLLTTRAFFQHALMSQRIHHYRRLSRSES
ncbi:hypothetical protein SCP_0412320 [Sparassis crispa]|uniref:Uncharacterized protein n=1 Tax=Sparassis crispa TaxID=139825 RepID=A0A401GKZ5_9APHY|nr:hypothetical protein SCP_0412320 [Sparassis crispa]GBE82845.1 hypothetical protein SCP_0412320 [Sparassis crispa]